jgi:Pyridoxamine 5'-phosphate oxidase
VRWSQFEHEARRLAGLGRELLGAPGVVLVVTIRADGSPRLSPVEPLFWNGDLWLSMGWRTRKAADLGRDPRILVHSIVTSRDGTGGEYKLRGTAIAEPDWQVHERYAAMVEAQLGWKPEPGRFHLFRVDVADVTFIRWNDATNDQYVTRWPEGSEFVRRGTSATSLGEPEPIHDLFA